MNTHFRLHGWSGPALITLALLGSFLVPCRAKAQGCASCDDLSKEVKFRAAGQVKNGQNTAGTISLSLNGVTVVSPGIPEDAEQVVVTSEGGTKLDPEKIYQGTATVSSDLLIEDFGFGAVVVLRQIDVEFKEICGYEYQVRWLQGEETEFGDWHNRNAFTWTGVESAPITYQLRLRKEDEPDGGSDGQASVSPPTIPADDYDAAPGQGGAPSQIEPAGFSATIPMGATPQSGRFNSGSLSISGTLSPSSADVSHLEVSNPGYADTAAFDVVSVNDEVRQVKTTVRLADVQELTGGGFEVLLYEADDFTPTKDGNGLYPIDSGATPSATYRIEPVATAGAHLGGVAFTKEAANGLNTETQMLSTSGDGCSWQIVTGGGNQVATGSSGFDYVNDKWHRIDSIEVERDGVLFAKSNRTYQYQVRREGTGSPVVESGMFLVQDQSFTSETASLTTTYVPDTTFIGRAASVARPDGSWEAYTYYNGTEQGADPSWRGLRKEVLRPWDDEPASAAQATPSNAEVTTYMYAVDADGGLEVSESTTTLPTVGKVGGSRKLGETGATFDLIDGLIVVLGNAGLHGEWLPRHDLSSNELDADANERDVSATEAVQLISVTYVALPGEDRPWVGRQFASLDDLGNGSVTGYELGTYNAQAGTFSPNTTSNQNTGTDVRSLTVELRGFGLPSGLEGSLRIAVEDAKGHPLREELYILDASQTWSETPATVLTYDYPELWPDGSAREVIRYQDGRVFSRTRQLSGTETAAWDEQGIETRTFSDALGRMTASVVIGHATQPDRVTTYQYAGRSTVRTLRGGPAVLATSEVDDLLGRTISRIDETGAETVTTYPNGGLETLVTLPGGPTRHTARNIDGRITSVTGTAVVSEFFAYAALDGGLIQTTRRLGAVDSLRYGRTIADWAGREIAAIRPSPTESGEITVTTTYHPDTTRVISRASDAANTAPEVFTYPSASSSLVLQGYELGEEPDGTLDPANDDRVTETGRRFELVGNVWWEVSTRKVYDGDGAESAITNKVMRRVHGNTDGSAAQTIEVLPGGGMVTTSVAFDCQNKTRTETVERSNYTLAAVSTNVNGLVTLRTSHDSSQPTVYQHDGLGRITKETNPRGGVKRQTWRSDGKLGSLTVQAAAPTVYDYYPPDDPAAGRLWKVTNPKGMTTIYAYNDLGKIEEISGSAEYPRTHEYDAYGELWKLTTKYGETPQSATTKWIYQTGTGLLARKEYADTKGTDYTYYASGKLATRTWARLNGSVVTTWSYNAFGDLTGIAYSDSTPDVSIPSVDRLGRPLTITQSGIGSETLTYHPGTNAKDQQYCDANHAYLPGIGLRHAEPDAHGREMGFDETAPSAPQGLRTVDYVWDDAGRMDSVTDEEGTHLESHEYGYHPNSSLIATIDSQDDQVATWFRESRLYDVSGRLVSIRSDRVSGQTESPLTRYAYRLDDLNRREKVTLLDGSKWDYGYNERSEVESATRKDGNGNTIAPLGSAYTYDDLGNRLTSASPVLGDLSYIPNQLNQYGSIAADTSRTAVGRAPAGTVTVNGQGAPRVVEGSEIYSRELTVQSRPAWLAVNTNWSTTSIDRHFWYPAATTTPSQDWDGNLENDGRWVYTWDAENRLVQMETTETAEQVGHPYRKLRYAYDWQSRRIARTVWHGTREAPAFHSSQRWLYDAWTPVTEFTATAESEVTPTRSITLTWGIDLSGTLQGAGGVSGLLATRKLADSPATTHRPCFDGNGNVVGWLKHGDSLLEARREYDPFGNPLVEEGTEPVSIGFSTKMRDDETGLLYFGYRWYGPPTGRWPSRDPLGEQGGTNLFGFISNDGIGAVDKLGLEVILVRILSSDEKKEGTDAQQQWKKDKSLYEGTIKIGVATIAEFISQIQAIPDDEWEEKNWAWKLNPGNGQEGEEGFTESGKSKAKILEIANHEKKTRVVEFDGKIDALGQKIQAEMINAGPYAKLIIMGHGMGHNIWFANGDDPTKEQVFNTCNDKANGVNVDLVTCLQDGKNMETVIFDPMPTKRVRHFPCKAWLRLFSAKRHLLGENRDELLGIGSE